MTFDGGDIARLLREIERLAPGLFAVVDGAHWSNVRAELFQLRFFVRSLYSGAGTDTELAGPWMVGLPQIEDASRLAAWVGEKPAVVFWSAESEGILWHHLRTLNQARVDRIDASNRCSDVVMFRHWDPRVLSVVLPLFEEAQHAQVLGPAKGAVFYDPPNQGGDGIRRLVRPEQAERTRPRGRLHVRAEQVEQMAESMARRSQRKISAYLVEVAPAQTRGADEQTMLEFVGTSRLEAREFGLHSERAVGQWAYLSLIMGSSPAGIGSVRKFITLGGGTPEANLDLLLREMGRNDRG